MRNLFDSIRTYYPATLRSSPKKANYRRFKHLSLLDLGADSLKAIVAQRENGAVRILGYGIASVHACALDGDRTSILTLAVAADEALTTAEDRTASDVAHKVVPDDAVFCLPARFIRSRLVTLHQRRLDPAAPVSAREVARLRERVEKLLHEQLIDHHNQNETWKPLASATSLMLAIDGHPVSDAIGLKGKMLSASIFGFAAPSRIVDVVATIAKRLEVSVYAVVAGPQSLATLVPQRDAILLDVGGQGTNLNLIRHNALVATVWWPQGGELFTSSLAQKFRCIPERAEALKRAYVDNTLSREDVFLVKRALEKPLSSWFESFVSALRNLTAEHHNSRSARPESDASLAYTTGNDEGILPGRVFVTGGGSLLPDLMSTASSVATVPGLHFDRAVEVQSLGSCLSSCRSGQSSFLLNVPPRPMGDLLASAIGSAASVVW